MRYHLFLAGLAYRVLAQNPTYGQCGGLGWAGSTSCVSGSSCVYSNPYYSQCLPGATPTTTLKTSTTTRATTTAGPSPTSGSGKFKWLGVNQSGAEFGTGSFPGTWGKEYIWPSESSITTLVSQGYNIMRVAFSMERLVPNSMSGTPNSAYLANLTATVNSITSKGAYAILDPHNFGRYYGNIITDTAAFQTFWKTVATAFKSNSRAIFDTNNEYHDMDDSLVLRLNQAAINGIRGAGATSQYIMAEGNSWSGAWTWTSTGNVNLASLKDPQGKLVYEMHQYLDSDGSGTAEACVSGTIGKERVVAATQWLRAQGKVGFLGEFAGGANAQCKQAVERLLDYLRANSDVWMGASWWAAGPWWASYMYSFEPPSGTGYVAYNSLLRNYLP